MDKTIFSAIIEAINQWKLDDVCLGLILKYAVHKQKLNWKSELHVL